MEYLAPCHREGADDPEIGVRERGLRMIFETIEGRGQVDLVSLLVVDPPPSALAGGNLG